jgi:hypothetical protein
MMLAAATAAAPQAAPVASAPSTPLAADAADAARGVIAYPPSFFAESQPANAYDMVLRVPGFAFDKGAAVRGLAGAGGNVLIDGQTPVSKTDSLDEILKRIPHHTGQCGASSGCRVSGRRLTGSVLRLQWKGTAEPTVRGAMELAGRALGGVQPGVWQRAHA